MFLSANSTETDMAEAVETILDFWLTEIGEAGWYEQNDEVDATLRARFGALWRDAAAGRFDAWITEPSGALALLILLDQFPRNMWRGAPEAFATDRKARALAKRAIALGHDRRIPEPERQFFYLPLMHAEALPDQERCVRLIRLSMTNGAVNLDHACKHREVIRKFGRFPSRNQALGRADTDAERAYRAAGGYMS